MGIFLIEPKNGGSSYTLGSATATTVVGMDITVPPQHTHTTGIYRKPSLSLSTIQQLTLISGAYFTYFSVTNLKIISFQEKIGDAGPKRTLKMTQNGNYGS